MLISSTDKNHPHAGKTKCRMHILVYSVGTKATRRKAAVHYAAHSLSRVNLKNLMLRSFTFVCQLYCRSSKHNNNKALRITFNSCKTASTSSMALATVNIDKIIKVTSASPYVYSRQFAIEDDTVTGKAVIPR